MKLDTWQVPCSVHPLTDLALIERLCRDPYIARVGHDHRRLEPIHHPEVHYLGAQVAGCDVGAFMIIETGFIERDVHALLTRSALPWSRQLGWQCLDFIFADPMIERVTAQIIEGLDTARNYCLRLGFKHEGKRRNACMKDGRLVDVHVLGILRHEWEAKK